MTLMTDSEFHTTLIACLKKEDGPAAVGLLPRDPHHRFARSFNRLMEMVDAESIEIAYFKPLAVLAGKVEQGLIPDPETLFRMLYGIQNRTAWKLNARAARRANPQVRVRRRGEVGPAKARPLFVPTGGDLDSHPGREPAPSYAVERWELFRVLLTEARKMGRLATRVYREVRRHAETRGTLFGAFTEVAKLAVLDPSGRVVSLRSPDPNNESGGPPPKCVVRQVRTYYRQATEYLDDRREEGDTPE